MTIAEYKYETELLKGEYDLSLRIFKKLCKEYPTLIPNFRCNLMDGAKMDAHTRARCFIHKRGRPDFEILTPRGGFGAAYIELKTLKDNPFQKNGQLKKNKHIQEQEDMILLLLKSGYYADFAVGYDDFMEKATNYLSL